MKKCKRRILLVDDNPGDALLVRLAVQELDDNIEVAVVSTGTAILETLEQISPSLVLLDLNLPAKTGFEVLCDIRSSRVWKALPVVMFTTSGAHADIAGCYDIGASGYLMKPNDLASFGDAILRIVEYWFGTVELPMNGNGAAGETSA